MMDTFLQYRQCHRNQHRYRQHCPTTTGPDDSRRIVETLHRTRSSWSAFRYSRGTGGTSDGSGFLTFGL